MVSNETPKRSSAGAQFKAEGDALARKLGKEMAIRGIKGMERLTHAQEYENFLSNLVESGVEVDRNLLKSVAAEREQGASEAEGYTAASDAILGDTILKQSVWSELIQEGIAEKQR